MSFEPTEDELAGRGKLSHPMRLLLLAKTFPIIPHALDPCVFIRDNSFELVSLGDRARKTSGKSVKAPGAHI